MRVRSECRRMHAAATLIQRRVRTWPDRDDFHRRRQLLVVLQRRIRHRFCTRRAAARRIQRFMRARWRRARIAQMVTRLQAMARGAMWRKPFLAYQRRRVAAATTIQVSLSSLIGSRSHLWPQPQRRCDRLHVLVGCHVVAAAPSLPRQSSCRHALGCTGRLRHLHVPVGSVRRTTFLRHDQRNRNGLTGSAIHWAESPQRSMRLETCGLLAGWTFGWTRRCGVAGSYDAGSWCGEGLPLSSKRRGGDTPLCAAGMPCR
jgi:hypothetical protein